MKGRGTRVISPTDLQAVTPDAKAKTHFVIVDAVGVCESNKTDSRPLERKRGVAFDKLRPVGRVRGAGRGHALVAGGEAGAARPGAGGEGPRGDRPSRAGVAQGDGQRAARRGGPRHTTERAKELFGVERRPKEQVWKAGETLAEEACTPARNGAIRNTILEIHRANEQTIDTVSEDTLLEAKVGRGGDGEVPDRGGDVPAVHRGEPGRDGALQTVYSRPYGHRHFTYDGDRQLAEAITMPPYGLTTERVAGVRAARAVEGARRRAAELLTDIISLVRFALGDAAVLEPFEFPVRRAFDDWMRTQAAQGRTFTDEQVRWLETIRDQVATSAAMDEEDFDQVPFNQ